MASQSWPGPSAGTILAARREPDATGYLSGLEVKGDCFCGVFSNKRDYPDRPNDLQLQWRQLTVSNGNYLRGGA